MLSNIPNSKIQAKKASVNIERRGKGGLKPLFAISDQKLIVFSTVLALGVWIGLLSSFSHWFIILTCYHHTSNIWPTEALPENLEKFPPRDVIWWRHQLFVGSDQFWQYVTNWWVIVFWSTEFFVEWCTMLLFSPERLLYLSRHMDKHFSKFQCIGINWWRHHCQNKPNSSIFPCIDHFLYLRFYDSVTLSAYLESFIKQSYNHAWNVVKISKMAN